MSSPASALQTSALQTSDPTRLAEHLGHCALGRSPMFRLRSACEAVDAWMAPRFISTVVALALAGAVAAVLM